MAMNVKRMKLAIKILRALKPTETKAFDMEVWFAKFPLFARGSDPRRDYPADCGTVACALGTLALDPRFQRMGLCTDNSVSDVQVGASFIEARANDRAQDTHFGDFQRRYDPSRFNPIDFGNDTGIKYTNRNGYNFFGAAAGARLFGITLEQSEHLFLSSEYDEDCKITPDMVADRMEKMVKDHMKRKRKD